MYHVTMVTGVPCNTTSIVSALFKTYTPFLYRNIIRLQTIQSKHYRYKFSARTSHDHTTTNRYVARIQGAVYTRGNIPYVTFPGNVQIIAHCKIIIYESL